MCVIDRATKGDTSSKFPGQSKYVPWLVCMDSNKDDLEKCNAQVSIQDADVQDCLANDAKTLLADYMKQGSGIHGTPTVYVNGKNVVDKLVVPSYSQIKTAICNADNSFTACSSISSPEDHTSKFPMDVVAERFIKPAPVVV